MGYTIDRNDSKMNQDFIKKSIESNDRNNSEKMKHTIYENMKNIVLEKHSIKHIKKPDNNTTKKTIHIGL